jgi:membrane-associated phospholipid phosphatase
VGVVDALRLVGHRLEALWQSKLVLTLVLATLTQGPYFLIQRFPLWSAHHYAPSSLDRWVGLDPGWVWVYLSVYLLVPIAPWLVTEAADLRRYARGIVWLALIACTIFLLYPIVGPRPDPLPETNALYDFLVRLDRPTNSFPALHVAVPAYSLLFGASLLPPGQGGRPGRVALVLGWLWLLLVAYATLATKQHFVADVAGGLALGWLVSRWVAARSSRSLQREGAP